MGRMAFVRVPPAEKIRMLGELSKLLKDRRMWLVLVILAFLAGVRISGLDQYLSIDVLRANRRELMDFVQTHQLFAMPP